MSVVTATRPTPTRAVRQVVGRRDNPGCRHEAAVQGQEVAASLDLGENGLAPGR